MEASIETGVIYSLTCKMNGKSYIGRTNDFKPKNGKHYKHGVEGRWKEHISENCKTPISKAILEYGPDNFIVTELFRGPINTLDALVAETITFNNTLVPNGYNVSTHSHVKDIKNSNITDFYVKTTLSVKVHTIKVQGKNALICVYIKDVDEDKKVVKFTFGKGNTFQSAISQAMIFIEPFRLKGIFVSIHPEIMGIEDPLAEYHMKLAKLVGKNIDKIIINIRRSPTFSTINITVFVGKKKTQIYFGGRKINVMDSYKLANLFVERIKNQNTKIEETEFLHEALKFKT